jgi:hypothetical protein
MDARGMAEGISEGVNALCMLLIALDGGERVPGSALAPHELSSALDVMEEALAALLDSKTVWASFRPEYLPRIRRLRHLIADWQETGVAAADLRPLVEDCLAVLGVAVPTPS